MYTNTNKLHGHASQRREQIVALGSMGYQNATNGMMAAIANLSYSVAESKKTINWLGEFTEGEAVTMTRGRKGLQYQVKKATGTIEGLNKLHDEVTKRRANPNQRTIGFVLPVVN